MWDSFGYISDVFQSNLSLNLHQHHTNVGVGSCQRQLRGDDTFHVFQCVAPAPNVQAGGNREAQTQTLDETRTSENSLVGYDCTTSSELIHTCQHDASSSVGCIRTIEGSEPSDKTCRVNAALLLESKNASTAFIL